MIEDLIKSSTILWYKSLLPPIELKGEKSFPKPVNCESNFLDSFQQVF